MKTFTCTPATSGWICIALTMASTPPAATIAEQLGGLLKAIEPRAAHPCSATVGCLAWVVMAATMSPRPPASTMEVLTSSFPAMALRRVQTCLEIFYNKEYELSTNVAKIFHQGLSFFSFFLSIYQDLSILGSAFWIARGWVSRSHSFFFNT